MFQTIECEFCQKQVDIVGTTMVEAFWDHYQLDCLAGNIRLTQVIHSMMAAHHEEEYIPEAKNWRN